MPPKLEHLLTYHADLEPAQPVGLAPGGNRVIYGVTGGKFEGPGLKGDVLGPGGDWFLMGSDGVGRLDVRATLRTEDGALIYLQYYGVLVLGTQPAGAGGGSRETQYGDRYFMTQPRFETGDERYKWLNELVCVAEGRTTEKGVEYRVYKVVNG